MKTVSNTPRPGWLSALRTAAAVVAFTGFGMGVALAATPLAGTTIGNQASATYTDASLIGRNATSNTVTTIVQQVAAFTLTSSQSKFSAPGAPISFAHTITNNGNGIDGFTLAASAPTGNMVGSAPQYFIDANCDGIADNATAIVSVAGVAPGASACFIVTATVSVLAANASTGTLPVQIASVFAPATAGVTNPNTDTITVTANAVVTVSKSISIPSGPAGTTPVKYTLTYTNTGNTAATNLILSDFLPTNMTYIANSAQLNGVGLTDSVAPATGATAATTFDFGLTGGVGGRATAIITSLGSGVSGTLSFNVTVSAAAAPGQINNQARICYNDGAVVQPVVSCTPTNATTSAVAGSGTPSNTATFTVLQTALVAANADAVSILIGGVTPTFDTVTVASATQGATVVFNDYIHNNGNGTDTFNVTLSAGTFPAGTTFTLFKSDGVTPLTDTNAIPDGIVDTGPVAAGTAYLVVVKATLPSGVSGGGAYANVLTAKSTFDATKSDPVNNSLTTITPNTVDLTTGASVATATAGALGLGAGPSTASVLSSVVGGIVAQAPIVNPGVTVTYPLYVNNTSTVADTYAISATALPAGWSVAYYADGGAANCTTLLGTVTNTGIINAGANKLICAVVTTAATGATAAPGATSMTFSAISPTTAASDTKLETVTLNTVRALSLTPVNNGQVFPGGTVIYAHILTNNGNVTEGAGAGGSTITMTDPLSGVVVGWNNAIYWDANNDGVLDATDPVLGSGVTAGVALNTLAGKTTDGVAVLVNTGFPAGKSIRLFVKVFGAASAAAGDINTSSLTATDVGAINTIAAPLPVVAADNTTVIVGQVTLVKTQALDAACDGVADTAFSNAPITTGAAPGSCVLYKVTATNVGTQPVNSVMVSDATPANTLYKSFAAANGVSPAAATTVGALVAFPVDATVASITANLGTLAPGASAVITFGVRINP